MYGNPSTKFGDFSFRRFAFIVRPSLYSRDYTFIRQDIQIKLQQTDKHKIKNTYTI